MTGGKITGSQMTDAEKLFRGVADFVAGAAGPEAMPDSTLPEVAFAGRSNVGKSSLLNALTGRKALARTSRSPGRTQQINFFDIGGRLMLVDLPGYGYAQVSAGQLKAWRKLITFYLTGRAELRRVLSLIDARHGPLEKDLVLMAMLNKAAVPFQVILTKADKIPPAEQAARIESLRRILKKQPAAMPEPVLVSSQNGFGIAGLRQALFETIA